LTPTAAQPPSDSTRARFQALLEVAESISAHRQLSTLFADLSRLLKALVPFDFMGLTLVDNMERVVRLHILETDQPVAEKLITPTPFEQTPTIFALQTRRPYYIHDVSLEQRFPIIREILRANRIQSVCILPLFTAQHELGGLHFGSLVKDAYSPDDIQFMGQVARQVAVAVDNALNSEAALAYETQLSRERDRLRALLEVNNAVVTCLGTKELFKELFAAIAGTLRRRFGIDYASLLIYDPEIQSLRLQMLDFPESTGAIQQDAVAPLDDSLAGHVFRTRQGRVFSPEEMRAISPNTARLFEREGIAAICAVPLVLRNETLGTLNVGSRQPDRFHEDDLQFFTQVAAQVAIALDNALTYKRIEELNARLEEEKIYLEGEIRTDSRFEEIVGQSRALKTILKQVETVAPTDSTVLIYGETGTGKELLARAIHDLSARKQGTFVKLNCAAIPTGLLESELFGHEKGAFTGAIAQRIGRFELANRGTIFLDEVGEIPIELQSKLLRVLQEREFERLGSSRTIRTDARLVAATNRDLTRMVEDREFRADLYYRLNVFPITVPALRDRPDDIPLLVNYFVQQYARTMNRRITSIPKEAMHALTRYHWPGNIRELQNFIERAVILTTGTTLHVPVRELKRGAADSNVVTLETAERDAIVRALRDAGGKVGGDRGAAAKLGMKRTTLQAKMRKLGIDTKAF
jgi:formate hydrogenlyase transcriptional activator